MHRNSCQHYSFIVFITLLFYFIHMQAGEALSLAQEVKEQPASSSSVKPSAQELALQEAQIIQAVKDGNCPLVLKYLAGNKTLANSTEDQIPLLCLAARNSDFAIVQLLLLHNANIQPPKRKAYHMKIPLPQASALHIASKYNNKALAELLIEQKADINARDDQYETPLHYAGVDVIPILVQHSAQLDAQNIYGQTPLHRASQYSRTAVVQCLLEHKANIDTKDNSQNTPLHMATKSATLVKTLLDARALYSSNAYGETPFQRALGQPFSEAIDLLKPLELAFNSSKPAKSKKRKSLLS